MHDLIFAVAFIAMVASPAMVATFGGRKEYNPGPATPGLRRSDTLKARPAGPVIRPASLHKPIPEERHVADSAIPTLPMHNARGMSNR